MQSNCQSIISLIISIVFLAIFSPLATLAQDNEKGSQLYLANCAKCHGHQGEGFLKLYPPIRNSQYLKADVSKLPCIIRNGLRGEIVLDTTIFNQIMPGNQQLTSEQMDHIIRYMQITWGHSVTRIDVKNWLLNCPD